MSGVTVRNPFGSADFSPEDLEMIHQALRAQKDHFTNHGQHVWPGHTRNARLRTRIEEATR